MRPALLSTALVLAAMAAPARADHSRPRHGKPSAPVTLTLTSQPAIDGVRVVVLDAVVTRDVPAIELRLGSETVRFGATRAGTRRRLEARVPATSAQDVIGSARVGSGDRVRTRAVSMRVGPAAADKPFVLYTVKGRSVAEVRE